MWMDRVVDKTTFCSKGMPWGWTHSINHSVTRAFLARTDRPTEAVHDETLRKYQRHQQHQHPSTPTFLAFSLAFSSSKSSTAAALSPESPPSFFAGGMALSASERVGYGTWTTVPKGSPSFVDTWKGRTAKTLGESTDAFRGKCKFLDAARGALLYSCGMPRLTQHDAGDTNFGHTIFPSARSADVV